jgi:hypothetical protein
MVLRNYSRAPVTRVHLTLLRDLAIEEHRAFFSRNPGAAQFYRERFLGAALCQGAAWHYVGHGEGVKDFDIHLFYEQHPVRKQLSRTLLHKQVQIPGFGLRMVDLVKTIVPARFVSNRRELTNTLRGYLKSRPTKTARCLAQKAVVGLVRMRPFGVVIWP